ncbi:SARP family transcriptional regulator [Asanoa ishikariensis]|uniref:DNA-binding transcriptional activator of the SARP family n=1 Tax=Asanoa ishikariensis TaxID=137265 RepID=A0A1H3MJ81_9ACTN|nr:BTAD domain-containing putative transcriptional regulator [Asanoa ishikariensis]GIF66164.1 SARP family transcriptional regulator [Asanoa ishikariensis]SDY76636.1 DNA-binding transcriptional activator of the SARP family [Asanoa ishikariensis]
MEFRLLGPVEVSACGGRVGIGRRQERWVLAILLLEAGQAVPVGRLVELIWSGEPPRGARGVVQTYISRLRALLGDAARIVLHNGAYRIDVDPQKVDAHQFAALVAEARESDDPHHRGGLLRDALALWRGPALEDVGPGRERLAARLEEARKTALDLRIVADLEAGQHGELIGELTELCAGAPLDERLAGHLMTALFRDGRRPDALAAYGWIRDRVRTELGLEPGDELRQLHTRILRDDPALRPAPAGKLPAQLPATVPDFVGRAALLDELDELLRGGRTPVVISAIDGAGGVGKTALAVRWGHRVADRFPDGQLFVNLRGYEAAPPVRPVDALARFLRALGVPGDRIPPDPDEAGALFRSEIAGRRVLMVLDNAATADQVRPLLPGSPTCVVVVTSRSQLGGLTASHGARRLTVDLLSEPEALLLLRTIIGARRVDAEPAAATELVRACGLLPLAVRIAAAQLDAEPSTMLGDYLRVLDKGPLDRLTIEGDELSGVRATFRASYDRLGPLERDVFRLLGAVPGTDVDAAGAAALAGLSRATAAGALDGLRKAHLVTTPRPGRFGLHDLLRTYARELTPDDEAALAVGRLHAHYLGTADAAARRLYPHMIRLPLHELPDVAGFETNPAALAWLDAEHRNLLAAIGHAATAGPKKGSWQLTDALRGYFWQTSHTVDWLAAVNASLAAAEAEGDLQAQAAMRTSIALARQNQLDLAGAAAEFETAADLSARAGWSRGQAAAAGNLGVVLKNMGDFAGSARSSERALELHRANEYPPGEAATLITLGGLYHDLGELHRAADYCVTALAMHEEIGSPIGQLIALNNLGAVEHLLGEATAADRFRAAMELQSDVAKVYSQAHLLGGLAAVQRDRGELTEARANAEAALVKAQEAADPMVEGDILSLLGTVHHWLGDPRRAIEEHRRGLAMLGAGSEYVRTRTNISLAAALRDTGDLGSATEVASAALADAWRAGHRVPAGNAHLLLGSIHLRNGDIDRAVDSGQRALTLHRQTGHRLGEARSLRLLGDIARANGLGTIAREQWHAALALLSELGSGEIADVLKRN